MKTAIVLPAVAVFSVQYACLARMALPVHAVRISHRLRLAFVSLLAGALLLAGITAPATATVVHDESIDGDLGSRPDSPTPLTFATGVNTIIGTVFFSGDRGGDRDFMTFTIAAGEKLTGMTLVAYSPDNPGFLALNEGTTSFVPSLATDANFLCGLHTTGALVGADLMPLFVCCAVTTNSLAMPELGPGDYCFVIQQVSPLIQSYEIDFVVTTTLPVEDETWGAVKALFE